MAYVFNPFTGTFDNSPSTSTGDSAYSTLCAISGDLVTYGYLHDGFLPLSGGTVTGNLSVGGDFNVGSNANTTLFAEGTFVGINTETPNEELTVIGNISASNEIYVGEHQVIKTNTTTFPGISAVTKIIAVSALPIPQQLNTLYILV